MKKLILCTCFIMTMTACAKNVQTDDEFWFSQGERLGRSGYGVESDILDRIKAKVPFQITPYSLGYQKGLLEYCNPYNAFAKGISGIRYNGKCEDHEQAVMIKVEWQRGWDAFIGADFYKR
ncbi:DUF2799 domain-containing protein [Vibrio cortegadensis]|uniref:DUF2799 domain-containing protein n=1 Tax=Vibrio cortegadensis TaxID=1328770 RepID=A0ABV4M1K1_9VIBR